MSTNKGKVIYFHYRLYNEDDKLLEDSYANDPIAFLHGSGNIFPSLENAMEALQPGDSKSVTLPPEEAYGPRIDNAIRRISRKHVKSKGKLAAGNIINVQTDSGVRQVVIKKVGKFIVDVDSNHPFAGMTLRFDVEITNVREANDEERSHGHAHGAGGHQH